MIFFRARTKNGTFEKKEKRIEEEVGSVPDSSIELQLIHEDATPIPALNSSRS
jgi:hypothetical protein